MKIALSDFIFLSLVTVVLLLCADRVALSQESAERGADDAIARLLEEGVDLLQDGKLDDALGRFSDVLVLQPDSAEAYFHASQVYIRKNDWESAVELLQQAVKLEPKNARYSITLAAGYEKRGELENAIAEYQRLLSSGSQDELKGVEKNLALVTGKALAKKGELNAAILLFNGLLLEYPDDPAVLFNTGATYLLLNRADEAEQVFTKLVGFQPDNILARFNLASILERSGRIPEASKHLKTIMELNVPGKVTDNAKVKYYIIQARQYLSTREWEAALAAFRDVLEIDPMATEALFNIGLVNIELGNLDAAEKAFVKVLEIAPQNFSARLNLGGFYFDNGRIEEAIEQFNYVVEHDEDGRYRKQAALRLNMVHTILADKALEIGNVQESLREYEKAVDYFPGNIKPFFNRGLILIEQKNYTEARDAFLEVIRLDPNNARGRLNLANVYEELGESTKAAEQYEAVLQLSPEGSREYQVAQQKWKVTKARGLWMEHKLSDAIQVLEEILSDEPDHIEANFYLGIIFSAKGQLREAATAYLHVLEARPGNLRVRLLLAKLYEQLEMEELAANEYRTIIFEGRERDVIDEARERLALVENRLNGFSNNLGYSFSFDSNVNLNDANPGREVRSDLLFDIGYAHKFRNDLSFRLTAKPIYSTYHVGQFDFFSSDVKYILRKGTPEDNWSVLYGHQELLGLLSEKSVNNASNYHIERGMKLFLPAVLGLAPMELSGERVPTGLAVNFGVSTIDSFSPVYVSSWNPSLGAVLTQGLKWGVAANGGLSLSARRNFEQNQLSQPVSYIDPTSGQLEEYEVLTFDSRDYEYNSLALNLGLNKALAPGIQANMSGGLNLIQYVNVDSGAHLAGRNDKRKSAVISFTGQVYYQFHKKISFFGTLSWQSSFSTLAVSDFRRPTVVESVRNFQSTALGRYNRVTLATGLSMNF